MQNIGLYQILFLVLAVFLEILANTFLKMSDGFRRLWLGIFSLFLLLTSFTTLSQAIKGDNGFDLSVAYAVWGSLGVLATAFIGWIVFKQKLNAKGIAGLFVVILGMVILRFT